MWTVGLLIEPYRSQIELFGLSFGSTSGLPAGWEIELKDAISELFAASFGSVLGWNGGQVNELVQGMNPPIQQRSAVG